jgi:hypothetical protein
MTRRGEQEGEQGLARGVPLRKTRDGLVLLTAVQVSSCSSRAVNACSLLGCSSGATVGALRRPPNFATPLIASVIGTVA